MTMCLYCAQVEALRPQQQQSLFIWGMILMGVVVAGSFVIMMLRRRLRDTNAGPSADAGFSLSELRAMRDRGEITPEEYEQTRARVIAKVKANSHAPRPKRTEGAAADSGGWINVSDGVPDSSGESGSSDGTGDSQP
jgi:hypothetical protein